MESLQPSFTDLVSTQSMIFSCSVCQRIFDEIYSDGNKTSKSSQYGLGSKLWMTDCSHVTCGEHFKGGGVNFHPVNSRPRAQCPVCAATEGDQSEKRLFAITGLDPNEQDPVIPKEHFEAVIERIDESDAIGAAIKFQYMALARFGAMTHKRFQLLKISLNTINKEKFELADSLRLKEQETLAMKEEIEQLKMIEGRYQRWKHRLPEITAYLNSYAALVWENTSLKRQLSNLGYDVPQSSWKSLRLNNTADLLQSDPPNVGQTASQSQSSEVFATPTHSVVLEMNDLHNSTPSSSVPLGRKRQRRKEDEDHYEEPKHSSRPSQTSSGELMPPPPLPLHTCDASDIHECMDKRRRARQHELTTRSTPVDLLPRFNLNQQKSNIFIKSMAKANALTDEDTEKSFNMERAEGFRHDQAINDFEASHSQGYMMSAQRLGREALPDDMISASQLPEIPDKLPGLKNASFYGNHQATVPRPSNRQPLQPTASPGPDLFASRLTSRNRHGATFHPAPTPWPRTASHSEQSSSIARPRREETLASNSLNKLSFLQTPYNSAGMRIQENETTSSQTNSSGPIPLIARSRPWRFHPTSDFNRPWSVGINIKNKPLGSSAARTRHGHGTSLLMNLSPCPGSQDVTEMPLPSGTLSARKLFQRYAYHSQTDRTGNLVRPSTTVSHASATHFGPLKYGIRTSRGVSTSNGPNRNRPKLIR